LEKKYVDNGNKMQGIYMHEKTEGPVDTQWDPDGKAQILTRSPLPATVAR
jgi:hypothetical protein